MLRGGFGMFFDTPNANPFLDNRPSNNAPNGLEGNPGGPEPVYTRRNLRYDRRSWSVHLSRRHANHHQPVQPGKPLRCFLC